MIELSGPMAGSLSVEPAEFTLNVERMIVREEGISFDCCGRVFETGELYSLHDTAMKQPEGYYKAESIDDGVETAIYIFGLQHSSDDCTIDGFWYERLKGWDARVWRFRGVLKDV